MLEEARDALDVVSLRRARHVIAENERPARLADALAGSDFARAGALMNESHASLRDLYEVSSAHLDAISSLARAHPACFGARMTGAGFGGCAIALVRAADAEEFIAEVQPRYEAETYKHSHFFVARADDGARLS
jgi:galactokinase